MFREYGLAHARWRDFTVDHLVPIELGDEAFGVIGGRWDPAQCMVGAESRGAPQRRRRGCASRGRLLPPQLVYERMSGEASA